MKKFGFIFLVSMLVIPQFVGAQNRGACPYGFARMDSIGTERAMFLTEELGLTPKEAEAFMPLVDNYIKARFDIYVEHGKLVSDLRKKEARTTADYNAMMDDHLQSETKKLDLEKKFYADMRKVLPAEKAYKYRSSDHQFMNKLMDGKRNRQGGSRSGRGGGHGHRR